MVRIGLSIGAILVSLLFPSGRAVAARTIYAYMSPCEALGVACPDEGTETPPPDTGGGEIPPVYEPEPITPPPPPETYVSDPPPVYVPEPYAPYLPAVPAPLPLHSAAPLHPAGIPAGVSMGLLSLLALTATVLPAFRRKHV